MYTTAKPSLCLRKLLAMILNFTKTPWRGLSLLSDFISCFVNYVAPNMVTVHLIWCNMCVGKFLNLDSGSLIWLLLPNKGQGKLWFLQFWCPDNPSKLDKEIREGMKLFGCLQAMKFQNWHFLKKKKKDAPGPVSHVDYQLVGFCLGFLGCGDKKLGQELKLKLGLMCFGHQGQNKVLSSCRLCACALFCSHLQLQVYPNVTGSPAWKAGHFLVSVLSFSSRSEMPGKQKRAWKVTLQFSFWKQTSLLGVLFAF